MVFPSFFNLNLNLVIRSSWSEPQSASGLVFADCIMLLHLCLQEYNQSDFGIDHLMMSMCRVLCCFKRVFAMTSAFSWQNSTNLCPVSFCSLRPNLPITPGISWLPTFAFQSPIMKRTYFWGVSSKRSWRSSAQPFNFSFFSITGLGIDLDYCDIEWLALETNRDHSVIFEIASKYCISDSFVDYDGYSISSKRFLPTIVDIMVIWVTFTHSSPFLFTDS